MKTKNVALIAMMTAIIIVLGFVPPIPLGFIPVPIVLQNMGIMLAGAILGWIFISYYFLTTRSSWITINDRW